MRLLPTQRDAVGCRSVHDFTRFDVLGRDFENYLHLLNVEAGSFARLTACCVVLSFMLLLVRHDLRSHCGAQQTARQSVGL